MSVVDSGAELDRVFIRELSVEAKLGVYPSERLVRQCVVLDIEMAWDIRPAAQTEDLSLALDYKAVADRVSEFVVASEFKLVETLVEKVADLIMREFSVEGLSISCSKPQALVCAGGVGVKITRGRLYHG